MKSKLAALLLLVSISQLNAQNTPLPEFNDKPAYYHAMEKKLVDLEKSQYNTLAKAKGIFKAEAGFFLNGTTSPVKIRNREELKFIVKVAEGVDPTSVFDLAKFEVRDNKRILITAKTNATSSTNSLAKINYSIEKIKDGYYYLLVKDLDKGEYFLGSSQFMFAFSIE